MDKGSLDVLNNSRYDVTTSFDLDLQMRVIIVYDIEHSRETAVALHPKDSLEAIKMKICMCIDALRLDEQEDY